MVQAELIDLKLELFLRMREKDQIVWKTRNGEIIPINRMSDKHLMNTIKMIERQERREQEEQEDIWEICSDLVGLDMSDIS